MLWTFESTLLAEIALREYEVVTKQAEAKKNLVAAIESVAKMLGNTPAVCRKCYVHPEILDSYLEGDTIATIQQRAAGRIDRSLAQLKPEEAAVLVLLQRRLKKSSTAEKSVRAKARKRSSQKSFPIALSAAARPDSLSLGPSAS